VTSEDLSEEQLQVLETIVMRQLRFCGRLYHRMERLGFAGDDPLYLQAKRTHAELQHLRMEIHYLKCHGGVGKSPR
jgi:hypothetical protein